jgi:acyl carrier protein
MVSSELFEQCGYAKVETVSFRLLFGCIIRMLAAQLNGIHVKMSATPPKLPERFSKGAQEAYQRLILHRDFSGVSTIVLEAVGDFSPKGFGAETKERSVVDLGDGLRLVEDLGFDSLAIAEMVFFLEEIFQVSIVNSEIQSVGTLGDLRRFVVEKLKKFPQTHTV